MTLFVDSPRVSMEAVRLVPVCVAASSESARVRGVRRQRQAGMAKNAKPIHSLLIKE